MLSTKRNAKNYTIHRPWFTILFISRLFFHRSCIRHRPTTISPLVLHAGNFSLPIIYSFAAPKLINPCPIIWLSRKTLCWPPPPWLHERTLSTHAAGPHSREVWHDSPGSCDPAAKSWRDFCRWMAYVESLGRLHSQAQQVALMRSPPPRWFVCWTINPPRGADAPPQPITYCRNWIDRWASVECRPCQLTLPPSITTRRGKNKIQHDD